MVDPYTWLKSEKAELMRFLQDLPEDDVFMRPGFERRLKEVEAELEKLEKPKDGYEEATLLFDGKPVMGSRGIRADFTAEAMDKFEKLLKSIAAALTGRLQERGPVPNIGNVFITDTQRGSFGFRLMLDNMPAGQQADAFSSLGEAMRQLLAIFQTEGEPDKLSEIVATIHPRAAKSVGKFLNVLSRHEARPKISYRGQMFSPSAETIKSLAELLSEEKLREEDVSIIGYLLGVLPESRQYEFRPAHEGENSDVPTIIRGRIGDEIESPEELYKTFGGRLVNGYFTKVMVGDAKPKYILISLSEAEQNNTTS